MAEVLHKEDIDVIGVKKEWLDLSKEDLTSLYSPSVYSRLRKQEEAVDEFFRIIYSSTEETKKRFKHEVGVRYGVQPLNVVDIYLPEEVPEDARIVVYFHGGYWQAKGRDGSGFPSNILVPKGIIFISAGYEIAPGGHLPQMIKDAKEAVAFCYRRHPKSRGLFVCGHSSGGHLATMLLSVDWQKEYSLPGNLIKGVFILSGVFDLRPLVFTSINDALNLTVESALECSPIKHADEIVKHNKHCPVWLIYGDHDPQSFKLAAEQMQKILKEKGMEQIETFEMKDADHWEVLENLRNEHYKLSQMLVNLVSKGEG